MQSLGFTFSQINSDILHQIAESCGDSRTHINCSLVCRTWQDVFSRYVFRSIHISSTARLEWLMNILDQKPHMSSWIKVLTCRGCPQESPRNVSLIPSTIQLLSEKLVAVHTWKILYYSWSYKYDTNQLTIAKWSSVATLSATDCYFDADAFHILISILPRLRYFPSFDGTSFIKKITTADKPTITAGTPFFFFFVYYLLCLRAFALYYTVHSSETYGFWRDHNGFQSTPACGLLLTTNLSNLREHRKS
ncbi:hypothetical protein C8Q75DRAFT_407296 [Abortiporus biennis]|nr:hypothetical protein C8Q75DRAFT_407296 [Abortiporus biennis]